MGTYIEYDATLIDGSTTFVVNTVFCVSLAAAGGSAIVTIAAGNAGVSVTGSYPSFTISNDMTLTAGTNVTITGTYPNYIINSTGGGGGGSGTVTSIDVDGGTGISVSPAGPITTSGTFTVTNTAPDQVVSLTDGTGISTSGTYPNFTITNTAPDQTVSLSAGTGISTSGTYPSFTVTNTAPDQIVSLTAGSGISVSGTYPSFTISGTVTGGIPHATASGTDTYTATIAGVASYNDGDAYLIRFTNGNTNAATLNINGLGAVSLYRNNDGPLIGGDIWAGGEMICVYNSTTSGFQCIGTSPNSLFSYVTNDDSVTITKGQPVYAFSGTGNRMTVKLAYNSTDATSAQTVGIVYSTSIAPNQKGFIMMQGLLDGLSTLPTSTWTDGDTVYLGATAGTITPTKPYAPNHLVYLGVVTTASPGSAGRMYVRVQNGYELSEIHDVDLVSTPPVNNDVLTYITGSPNLWKPRSLSTILGYTPQAQLNGTGFVKATGTTISYDNSTYTPTSRTLTIDGTSYDLSADRSWTTGGNYSAYTMKANNTASTAAPANFTFKDLGDQALPTSPTWNGTAPSGTVNNRYRWFQIGNVVHYHFSFTYTTAGTGNTTLSFTHPSDMPVPVAFTGVPGAVAAPYFLYRALSYAAATLNTQPPTGWYGGLKVNSTGPTVYGWDFSGTSLSLTNWSVHGTYYT
jgi:hypothetical protein